MVVTLGDGRVVDCPTGIRRMPAGPTPEVLAAEHCRPTTVHPRRNGAERFEAPFAVFMHGGAPPAELSETP